MHLLKVVLIEQPSSSDHTLVQDTSSFDQTLEDKNMFHLPIHLLLGPYDGHNLNIFVRLQRIEELLFVNLSGSLFSYSSPDEPTKTIVFPTKE